MECARFVAFNALGQIIVSAPEHCIQAAEKVRYVLGCLGVRKRQQKPAATHNHVFTQIFNQKKKKSICLQTDKRVYSKHWFVCLEVTSIQEINCCIEMLLTEIKCVSQHLEELYARI